MDEDLKKAIEDMKVKLETISNDVAWLKCLIRKLDNRLWIIITMLVTYLLTYVFNNVLFK